MAKHTGITWTAHTFNPWWGCVEVSPACDNCYARELAASPLHGFSEQGKRGFPIWGKDAPRRFFGEAHWREPLGWNRQAERAGERHRVFCASMADVLETRSDAVGEQMDRERVRLWRLIAQTPSLDWLLLSKRPQDYRRLVPPELLALSNVWPGTTVESADYLWRADELVKLQCVGLRWVSYEPMLGPVDFYPVLGPGRIEWLVVGGESGPRWNAPDRMMDLGWLEDVADQCRRAGAALFVKQDNAYKSGDQGRIPDVLWAWKEYPRDDTDGSARPAVTVR
jgi:protein gp37